MVRSRGFTLIELLVVIAIIGILVGLAVPIIGNAMVQAKKTETRGIITSLETALNDYKTTYFKFPPFTLSSPTDDFQIIGQKDVLVSDPSYVVTPDWEKMYRVLSARSAPNDSEFMPVQNPKFREFLVLPDRYLNNPEDPTAATGFADAFGREFSIKLDTNMDKKLEDLPNVKAGTEDGFSRFGDIAIWSYGPDPEQVKDWVTSWR